MPTDFFDQLPPVVQWFVLLGAALAGAVMWRKGRGDAPPVDNLGDLREQLAAEVLRREFQTVVSAARKSFYDALAMHKTERDHECADLENRIRKLEQDVIRLQERGGSSRRSQGPRP